MTEPTRRPHSVYVRDSPVPQGSRIIHKSGMVPEEAVFLGRDEVLRLQNKMIAAWKPKREMWPFNYGLGFTGGLCVVTGAALNSFFRRQMKLYEYRTMTTFLASCMVPGLTAIVFQIKYVMEPILLREYDCAMCMTSRAFCGQMLFAGVQAPLISFLTCSTVATWGFRYTLPKLTDFSAWTQKAISITKPISGRLLLLTLLNGWYAGLLAYKQEQSARLIHEKLLGPEEYSEPKDEKDPTVH